MMHVCLPLFPPRSGNSIGPDGAIVLSASLAQLTALKELYLLYVAQPCQPLELERLLPS
jgi:hypothetical protein